MANAKKSSKNQFMQQTFAMYDFNSESKNMLAPNVNSAVEPNPYIRTLKSVLEREDLLMSDLL